MNDIDAILAAAKNNAANLPATAPLTPALAPVAGAGLPAMQFDMDMDSFLTPAGMEVQSYIQVKDAGIKLSKDWGPTSFIDEFEAEIDLTEVAFFYGIRKEVGSNVSYAKSYNGKTTVRGEPFAQVVAQFKAESQKPADPYRGADIPMTLTKAYADSKDKAKSFDAGTRVGLSTSITGFKPWALFHKKLVDAGQGQATIRVKVKHSARRNAANQDYGVCEFELLEIVGADRAAA